MKVAILLTGQLRTFEMVKFLHMNSLISQYDSDVFLGIDMDNRLQVANKNSTEFTKKSSIDEAIDFFKPIDTFVLNEFNLEVDLGREVRRFRQYYVVKNVYNLMKNHKEKNNIKYDLIVRLRFDQYIFSKEVPVSPNIYCKKTNRFFYDKTNTDILKTYGVDKKFIFKEINPNTLYVFGFGDFRSFNYKYANDQFFYHDESLIEIMFMFYDNMMDIFKHCIENKIGCKGCMTEAIFYIYVTNNNIVLKKSNIGGVFIREFT